MFRAKVFRVAKATDGVGQDFFLRRAEYGVNTGSQWAGVALNNSSHYPTEAGASGDGLVIFPVACLEDRHQMRVVQSEKNVYLPATAFQR